MTLAQLNAKNSNTSNVLGLNSSTHTEKGEHASGKRKLFILFQCKTICYLFTNTRQLLQYPHHEQSTIEQLQGDLLFILFMFCLVKKSTKTKNTKPSEPSNSSIFDFFAIFVDDDVDDKGAIFIFVLKIYMFLFILLFFVNCKIKI